MPFGFVCAVLFQCSCDSTEDGVDGFIRYTADGVEREITDEAKVYGFLGRSLIIDVDGTPTQVTTGETCIYRGFNAEDGFRLWIEDTNAATGPDLQCILDFFELGDEAQFQQDFHTTGGSCDSSITEYGAEGERIKGTFSGWVGINPQTCNGPGSTYCDQMSEDGELDIEITEGSFDVRREPDYYRDF
jgi:hypothetical protein